MRSQPFGEVLGNRLHAEHHTVLTVRTLRNVDATIAEVRSDRPTLERSDPLPWADAFCVGMQLRDFPRHERWEDGRPAAVVPLRGGQVTLYDLKRDPRFRMNHPFHSIHVVMPRMMMDGIADESGGRRIDDLRYTPGAGIWDPVIQPLMLSLQPALARPDEASRLFLDHVVRAIAHHVAVAYAHTGTRPASPGGLAPWQRRRALEFIAAHLDGNVTVADVARHCSLRLDTSYRLSNKARG